MTSGQHRFQVLNSWRGVAAIFVMLFHFRNQVNSHLYGVSLVHCSYLFVDFFFVLSGFVIFANYLQKFSEGYSFWKFMALRFGRVYPLHLFLLAVIVVFEFIHGHSFEGGSALVSNIFLLQGLGVNDQLTFNHQSWAVSAEFYAYALFAVLMIVFRRRVTFILPVVILLSGLFLVYKRIYLLGTYDYGFPRCLYSFAAGGLLWIAYERFHEKIAATRGNKLLWNALEILMVITIFIAIAHGTSKVTLWFMPLFTILIGIFAFEGGIVSRALSNRFFLSLGALSYSIYMLQGIAIYGFQQVLDRLRDMFPGHETLLEGNIVWGATRWEGDAVIPFYLLAVVAVAVFTYYLVEIPGRNYFRKLVDKKSGPETKTQ